MDVKHTRTIRLLYRSTNNAHRRIFYSIFCLLLYHRKLVKLISHLLMLYVHVMFVCSNKISVCSENHVRTD